MWLGKALLCYLALPSSAGGEVHEKKHMKRRRMLTLGQSRSRGRRPVTETELFQYQHPIEIVPTDTNVSSKQGVLQTENRRLIGTEINDSDIPCLPVQMEGTRHNPVPRAGNSDGPPIKGRGKMFKLRYKPTIARGLKTSIPSYDRISSLDDINRYQPLYPTKTPTTLNTRPKKPVARAKHCLGFEC